MGKNIAKSIKIFNISFSAIIVVQLIIIFLNVKTIGDYVLIDAANIGLKTKTQHLVEFDKNTFSTGMDGTLHLKIKTNEERIWSAFVSKSNPFTLLDIIYFIFLNIITFLVFWNVKEETIFSKRFEYFSKFLPLLIVIYPFFELKNYEFSQFVIEKLTKGQLTAVYEQVDIVKFVVLAFFVRLFQIAFERAKKLQEDQNLTI